MDSANVLDLVLLGLIGFAVVRGYLRGLVGPIFGIIAVCLGGAAAWFLYAPVARFLPGIESELGRNALACVGLFIIVAGAATWFFWYIERNLAVVSLSNVNRLAGAALGAVRMCLLSAFLIRTLYFHPDLLPTFQRSLMTPVVIYGGFAIGLFVPQIFGEPDTSSAERVYQHKELVIWLDSEIAADGTVTRTIRLTGNEKLLNEPASLLPAGPEWSMTRYSAGTGRMTVEASGKLTSPHQQQWALSDVEWSDQPGFFSSTFDLQETFDLRDYMPRDGEVYMPTRRPDDTSWHALTRALKELQDVLARRVSARLAESIVIPTHIRCTFPYTVQTADGPGAKVVGRTVTWDFDLDLRKPTKLSARAQGRGWWNWIICAVGTIVAGSLGWLYLRQKLPSILDSSDNLDDSQAYSDPNSESALPS